MERLTTRLSTVREFGGWDGEEVSESGPRKKGFVPSLRPRLFSASPPRLGRAPPGHPQPTATFPGARALRLNRWVNKQPGSAAASAVGRALENLPGPSKLVPQRPPGPQSSPRTHLRPRWFPLPPWETVLEAVGLPTCLIGDGRGYAPSPKGLDLGLLPSTGWAGGGKPVPPSPAIQEAPKVTGTWGRAGELQGGVGGRTRMERQPPGRLRLRPHVKAPRGKRRPGEPSHPPTLATPTLPPPAPAHTLTHTSEAEAGGGETRDQRLSLPPFFIECFKDISNFKRQLPKQPRRLVGGRAGGGCQPLVDFSLGGSNMCPGITFWKLPSSLAGHKVSC